MGAEINIRKQGQIGHKEVLQMLKRFKNSKNIIVLELPRLPQFKLSNANLALLKSLFQRLPLLLVFLGVHVPSVSPATTILLMAPLCECVTLECLREGKKPLFLKS